jgi:phthalate 4,5-dioxygenase oxygenase subunit
MCSFQAIVPKNTDWRAFRTSYVWERREGAFEPSYSTANA